MLNIVNELLFSFNTEKKTNLKSNEEFYKLSINTSTKVVRKNPQTGEPGHSIRTFACLTSPEKSYTDYNMIIKSYDNEYGKRSVMFRAVKESNYNANIFVIAFPFNGIIKPIPRDKKYRIHKGMISMSDEYSISFNNKKYRKILYLVIEPYMKIFEGDADHEAVDELVIPLESYSIIKDKDNPIATATKSNYDAMFLHITKDGYTIEWKNGEVEYTDMTQYKNIPLYNLYSWHPKYDKAASPDNGGYHKTYQSHTNNDASTNTGAPTYQQHAPLKIPDVPKEYMDRNDRFNGNNNHRRSSNSNYGGNKEDDYDDQQKRKQGNRGKKSKHRGY